MTHKQPRALTGRTVLIWFIAFFGVVFAVNAIMVRAATSTFGGVETESSYKAGLVFNRESEAAQAQAARGWKVEAHLTSAASHRTIDISARDADGAPLSGLALSLRLQHPTDARLDHAPVVREIGAGRFRAETDAAPGQWELLIELDRSGERLFRSANRLVLR
jgi:nitrogen fixation protein FixH